MPCSAGIRTWIRLIPAGSAAPASTALYAPEELLGICPSSIAAAHATAPIRPGSDAVGKKISAATSRISGRGRLPRGGRRQVAVSPVTDFRHPFSRLSALPRRCENMTGFLSSRCPLAVAVPASRPL